MRPPAYPPRTIKSGLISMLTSRKFAAWLTRKPTQNVLVTRYLVLSFPDREARHAPPDPPTGPRGSSIER